MTASVVVTFKDLTDAQAKELLELQSKMTALISIGVKNAVARHADQPNTWAPLTATMGIGPDEIVLIAGLRAHSMLVSIGEEIAAKHAEFVAANAIGKAQG